MTSVRACVPSFWTGWHTMKGHKIKSVQGGGGSGRAGWFDLKIVILDNMTFCICVCKTDRNVPWGEAASG